MVPSDSDVSVDDGGIPVDPDFDTPIPIDWSPDGYAQAGNPAQNIPGTIGGNAEFS